MSSNLQLNKPASTLLNTLKERKKIIYDKEVIQSLCSIKSKQWVTRTVNDLMNQSLIQIVQQEEQTFLIYPEETTDTLNLMDEIQEQLDSLQKNKVLFSKLNPFLPLSLPSSTPSPLMIDTLTPLSQEEQTFLYFLNTLKNRFHTFPLICLKKTFHSLTNSFESLLISFYQRGWLVFTEDASEIQLILSFDPSLFRTPPSLANEMNLYLTELMRYRAKQLVFQFSEEAHQEKATRQLTEEKKRLKKEICSLTKRLSTLSSQQESMTHQLNETIHLTHDPSPIQTLLQTENGRILLVDVSALETFFTEKLQETLTAKDHVILFFNQHHMLQLTTLKLLHFLLNAPWKTSSFEIELVNDQNYAFMIELTLLIGEHPDKEMVLLSKNQRFAETIHFIFKRLRLPSNRIQFILK